MPLKRTISFSFNFYSAKRKRANLYDRISRHVSHGLLSNSFMSDHVLPSLISQPSKTCAQFQDQIPLLFSFHYNHQCLFLHSGAYGDLHEV